MKACIRHQVAEVGAEEYHRVYHEMTLEEANVYLAMRVVASRRQKKEEAKEKAWNNM